MFDDPRKELARLQQELLAAEQEDEEEVWEEEPDDPEEALDEMKELLRRSDWEENGREPLYRRYSAEPEVIEEEPQPAKREKKKGPKKDGSAGLTFAIILEVAALLTFVVWWLLWKRAV